MPANKRAVSAGKSKASSTRTPGKATTSRKTGMRLTLAHDAENLIFLVRGERVMLDSDLARMYGVETRTLVQAVKRNPRRFPPDFMFQLSPDETAILRSQSVISRFAGDSRHGGRRYTPYAFTEQGVAMLSSVLRSRRAVAVNIEIMRAFVRLRAFLATHAETGRKLRELERRYDDQFRIVFDAIGQMMEPPEEFPPKRIGFEPD